MIKICDGTQFDFGIVEIFIGQILYNIKGGAHVCCKTANIKPCIKNIWV